MAVMLLEPSRLLALPGEFRNSIFEFALIPPTGIRYREPTDVEVNLNDQVSDPIIRKIVFHVAKIPYHILQETATRTMMVPTTSSTSFNSFRSRSEPKMQRWG
jgi:hypothetical protein